MYDEGNSKYCYPNSEVLINIPGYKKQNQLDAFERMVTLDRLRLLKLKPLKDEFDRRHLCDIHKFIFKDPFKLKDENLLKGLEFDRLHHTSSYRRFSNFYLNSFCIFVVLINPWRHDVEQAASLRRLVILD